MIPQSEKTWEKEPVYWVKAGRPSGNWVMVPAQDDDELDVILNQTDRKVVCIWRMVPYKEVKERMQ